MARIEERRVDDYGLPRQQSFGKMFWLGCVWGISAITALLLVMRSAQVFYFGHPVLHGARLVRFALFWAVFFLVVAFFEDFFFRGYSLFTLSQSTGFWRAAIVSSLAFGAIHRLNPGESWVGLFGAAAIGFFFCLTVRRTGSLWFAVGFHAAWDWGETFLWGVPDSGTTALGHLFAPSLVDGPTWLTGGTVGPEGSVLCFILIAVLWVLFHLVYPRATYKAEPVATAMAA
jgi:membrane protease YdiL (CAAX protease family)